MAKPFLLSFSLCLVLLTSACFAEQRPDRFHECQLDSINALEPDSRVESEAGVIETWNSNRPELRCAGVTFIKYTIDPEGLHVPSYTNYPQFTMILQGEGVLGISVPGCSETFEEPARPRFRHGRRSSQSQQQQLQDSHQKIRHFKEGDILAIPPGLPYWTYNYGKKQLVAISLLDITSSLNQLDPNPRRFYLAGNPEEEHPETQQVQGQQQQQQSAGGRKRGQHQQEEEAELEEGNVLSGFDPQFLAQAFSVDEDTISSLQSPDKRKQIVRVKRGLSVISPEWEEESEEEEEEEEPQPRQQGRRGEREERGQGEEEEEEPRRRGSSEGRRRGQEGEGGEEEEEETTTRKRHYRGKGHGQQEEEEETTTRERHYSGKGHGQQEEEEQQQQSSRRQERQGGQEEEEEEQPRQGRRESQRGQGKEHEQWPQPQERRRPGGNGLEETICTAKLRENIANPSRADLYNPTAGRISTVNSLTLPILKWFQLSAEYVFLYRNGIYAPHWNINANSVMYATRGKGWVQIVNCTGSPVFNGELRKGQLLVVPQNYVVAHQAGDEGFEFIAFKTNDLAVTSPLKQVFRSIPAEVLANAFGIRLNQVSQLKYNGNQGPLVSPPQSQDDKLVKVA